MRIRFAMAVTTWIASIVIAQPSLLSIEQELQRRRSSEGKFESAKMSEGNIDNSIDPNHYFIGGGDIFEIAIIGMPSIRYNAVINQNSDAFIPDLGIIRLGRVSLNTARDGIAQFVRTKLKYNSQQVYVTLVQCKKATVMVNGGVERPGTYVLEGKLRILDAIRAANNNELPPLTEFDYRTVQCRNGDSVFTVDLYKYLFGSDLSHNPYVYPGDNITLRKTTRSVLLTGEIRETIHGFIPIKRQETLKDFLSLFNLSEAADSTRIMVKRAAGIVEVGFEQWNTIVLQDQDVISIPLKKNYPQPLIAFISGEVTQPGHYPIIKGLTTAREIIEFAGGANLDGMLDRAFILRKGKTKPDVQTNISSINSVQNLSLVRPEVGSALTRMTTLNDYIRIDLKDAGFDVTLEHGDEVVVPKKELLVFVSGNVKRPGGYVFQESKPLSHYIVQAGGFTRRADRSNTFVVSQHGTMVQIKDKSDLMAGDIIVVPDYAEHKILRNVILPVIQTISTVLLALVAITK